MPSNHDINQNTQSRSPINTQRYFSSFPTDQQARGTILRGLAERSHRISRRIMNQSPSNRLFRRSPYLFSPPHVDNFALEGERFRELRGSQIQRITPQFHSDPPNPSIPLIAPRPIRIETQPRALAPATNNHPTHPNAL